MNIAAITTRNIPTISLATTLQEAGTIMRTADTGVLPVVEDGRLVGTLSERDLALRGCGAGLDPHNALVSVICNRIPIACAEDWPLRSALQFMRERRATWLVTLDRQGSVTGVVSLVELMDLLAQLVPEETDGPDPESVRRVRGGSFGV